MLLGIETSELDTAATGSVEHPVRPMRAGRFLDRSRSQVEGVNTDAVVAFLGIVGSWYDRGQNGTRLGRSGRLENVKTIASSARILGPEQEPPRSVMLPGVRIT